MQIMYLLGASEVQQIVKIVRCSARLIIEPKEIDNHRILYIVFFFDIFPLFYILVAHFSYALLDRRLS